MNLNITINEQEVREVAAKAAGERARNIASSSVGEHFASKRNYGSKDGPGTLIIQEKIDNYLLSQDLDTLIQSSVDKYLLQSIDALAKEVVRQRLGKIIFSDASASKINIENLRTILRGIVGNEEQKEEQQNG